VSVEDSAETYEGLTNDAGIEMQNRAMELTEEAAEELADNIRAELGVGFKVKFYV
jgi:hypothetical protein